MPDNVKWPEVQLAMSGAGHLYIPAPSMRCERETYVPLETIKERLTGDKAVESVIAQDHEYGLLMESVDDDKLLPETREHCAQRLETFRAAARATLNVAIAAAFKEDTEHGDQRRDS